jgi:ABC-2 type transport system permease protein
MYDSNTDMADAILQSVYRMSAMIANGMSADEANEILSMEITHETQSLGKDQMENYWYTYIMIFALYMVILLYGQMVATSVATEKSSRAMEVLITSAKPVSMMFGKVIAACTAGFIQLICVFGSAILFYNVNRSYWGESVVINSMFNMPASLLAFMLLFFVLGFFIYAFLFGAVGSTASRLEDINTSVMPITMLFIIAFMVVMFSMSSGNVDSLLMIVCSYIPFTSPMAMFARIAMSTVPAYEVVLSVVILVASVCGVGVLAAKIYRVGVLLYGTTPKIGDILKSVRKA